MNQYTGSNFDDFLAEEGALEEVTARAHKRLLALQLQDAMDQVQISKSELAGRLQTSRSQMVITIDGKPVVALVPIENADMETVTLSTHPQFLALIERSRARQKTQGGVSSDEMRRRLGL